MEPPLFNISFGRLSKPTALPDFNLLIAFIISLTFRSCSHFNSIKSTIFFQINCYFVHSFFHMLYKSLLTTGYRTLALLCLIWHLKSRNTTCE
jgi:hypothetical protein